MRHAEMIPLMGKIVTVNYEFIRFRIELQVRWVRRRVDPRSDRWAGWIVGFIYKQNGRIEQDGEDWEGGRYLKETSRQLCVLVKPWPTMKPIPVPLDGYAMGGVPVGPNAKGTKDEA